MWWIIIEGVTQDEERFGKKSGSAPGLTHYEKNISRGGQTGSFKYLTHVIRTM